MRLLKIQALLFVLFGLVLSLGISAGTVNAATVSDSDMVDVTAVVLEDQNEGSSGSLINQTAISVTGQTFPSAKVRVLIDGLLRTVLVASQTGGFSLVFNGLAPGNYQVSIISEDPSGYKSAPHVLSLNIREGEQQSFNNIVVPPTISANSFVLPQNDILVLSGYSVPNSVISFELGGSRLDLGSTVAGEDGFYRIILPIDFDPGIYTIRARALSNDILSLYSAPLDILVFNPNQVPSVPPAQIGSCVDYSGDLRVNLIDFSILLFWFEKDNPPANIDCNGDRRIDIKDFSLLMYYWTG